MIPGFIAVEHSGGGGKADQYFLRGFDADHGTDVAFFVDNMPINLRTHGHGRGYTDLSFIIPETIEGIDVVKGTYHEEFGDFNTAGAVRFKTREVLKENVVEGYRQSGDLFGIRAVATAGFQVRDDTISNISFGTQTKRVSTGTIVESAVQEASSTRPT